MNTRTFHGEIKAKDLASGLMGRFNHGNMIAQQRKSGGQYIVQVASRRDASSGGKTAIGVTIQQNNDGVTVKLGKQAWMGILASIGVTILSARKNPFNLIGRLDDLAQDIEYFGLDDQIWDAIDEIAETHGVSHDLSEKLKRTGCDFCGTANKVGEPRCIACGAPLGDVQPILCLNCGFVVGPGDINCSNCGEKLPLK